MTFMSILNSQQIVSTFEFSTSSWSFSLDQTHYALDLHDKVISFLSSCGCTFQQTNTLSCIIIALNGGKHWHQRTSYGPGQCSCLLENIKSVLNDHQSLKCTLTSSGDMVDESSSTVIAVYWWMNWITMTSECSESFIDASPVSLITGETDCWCWFLLINARLITEPQKD